MPVSTECAAALLSFRYPSLTSKINAVLQIIIGYDPLYEGNWVT